MTLKDSHAWKIFEQFARYAGRIAYNKHSLPSAAHPARQRVAVQPISNAQKEQLLTKPVPAPLPEHQPPQDWSLENRIANYVDGNGKNAIPTTLTAPKHYLDSGYQPTLFDIVQYYRRVGIVDEEELSVLQTLCAINRICFGIEGDSGSGKTHLVERLIALLPDGSACTVGLSSSKALHYIKNINEKKFLYIPELQKAMNSSGITIVEAIKDLSEGRDSSRVVTMQGYEGFSAKELKINKGITIIYTLANENGFKKDVETARRFISFQTKRGEDHMRKVMDAIARSAFSQTDRSHQIYADRLRNHIQACIDLGEVRFIDPFASYLARLIPATQKAPGLQKNYMRLVQGCALFQYNSRLTNAAGAENRIFINLEDHASIYRMYFSKLCAALKSFDSTVQEPPTVSWHGYFASGVENMRREYPHYLEAWLGRNVRDGAIKTINYMNGEELMIMKL